MATNNGHVQKQQETDTINENTDIDKSIDNDKYTNTTEKLPKIENDDSKTPNNIKISIDHTENGLKIKDFAPKQNGDSVSKNLLGVNTNGPRMSFMEEESAKERMRMALLKQCSAILKQGDQRYNKDSLHRTFQDQIRGSALIGWSFKPYCQNIFDDSGAYIYFVCAMSLTSGIILVGASLYLLYTLIVKSHIKVRIYILSVILEVVSVMVYNLVLIIKFLSSDFTCAGANTYFHRTLYLFITTMGFLVYPVVELHFCVVVNSYGMKVATRPRIPSLPTSVRTSLNQEISFFDNT